MNSSYNFTSYFILVMILKTHIYVYFDKLLILKVKIDFGFLIKPLKLVFLFTPLIGTFCWILDMINSSIFFLV